MSARFSKSSAVRVLLLVTVLGLTAAGRVRADNVDGRFGLSGLVGSVFPVAPSYVTDNTNAAGLDLGGQFSMQIGGGLGLGISFENMNLGDGQTVAPINFLFMGRFMQESRWTPTVYFGPGSARGVNSARINNFCLRAGMGVDYFLTPTLAIGPQFNYYFISHSGGTAVTYAHLTGLSAAITYFFGSANGG